MELTEYIAISISNIEKKIYRAKSKNIEYDFDMNILKRKDICIDNVDLNSKKVIDYLKLYQIHRATKIKCSDIENDMDYEVETEQHDYCHSSTWITDIVDNYVYSFYDIKKKEDIDLLMVLKESVKIAERKKQEDDLKMIYNFIRLISSKKIENRNMWLQNNGN